MRLPALAPLIVLLAVCIVGFLGGCAGPAHVQPRATELLQRGFAHLEAGDAERAAVAFEHALELQPDLPEGWNGAGVAAFRRGDLEGARRRFARALEAEPSLAEAHVNLGVVLLEAGEPAAAEAAFREALAIAPDLAVARLDLARALLHRGRAEPAARVELWGRAREAYLHLLETSPAACDPWEELAWMEERLGRNARAADERRRAASCRASPVPGPVAAPAAAPPPGRGVASR